MSTPVQHIVIVGGGTAGWLTACLLAARLPGKRITLVEAPDIPTIGVGEGTWPTMRETLATVGIPETEFLAECDAAFKQGSRFDGWRDGSAADSYLHPFSAPPAADMRDLAAAWQAGGQQGPFAAAITPQHAACAANLAPRQRTMPDYAGALNYGYHLDAGKFAALLLRHATQRLGVTRIAAQVTGVTRAANGDIAALMLHDGAVIEGDLFLDCSGQAAILIAGECGAEWVDRSDVSFNDRALAVQVPVEPGSPIAAQTIGTAHEAGWLWDIGLPTRRGIGCVYASRFISDDRAAEILRAYIAAKVPGADPASLTPRKLAFRTGHRDRFWIGNCLAVGLSAGFIEPLEASAIVLIELSLKALADNFPQSRTVMDIHAARFNELFRYRWDRVVEFLKLHYVPSQRTEPYWKAQRAPETIPPRLAECLALWREQAPSVWDFPRVDEMFPAASQQYVLYGMGVPVPLAGAAPAAPARLADVAAKARALVAALPTTRDYLDRLAAQAAATRIPYTRAIAHDAGWQWRIPLQHRQGNGIVYCSRYLDKDAALDRLFSIVEVERLTPPNFIRFTTGARRKQWHRNCIAAGLSGGFMEPLESTSIHLIQRAILRLVRMLPMGKVSKHDVAEFNDQQMTDMEQIRDFLILHYKATDRRDSPFWRQCAAMDIPDSLTHKIELFRETGRVFRKNEELFVENSWVQVMMGQGIMPQSYHPVATKLSDAELAHLLSGLRESVAKTVAGLPDHQAYVAQYCGAQEARAA